MNGEPQPLLIDRAASARRLEEAEVASWGEEQRVFVSSVMDGYADPRDASARAIESVGAEPVMFERFGGRDDDPEAAYLAEVESSTIYVGLLGARYGRLLPSRYSATHAEYLHAEERGLRLSVWTEKDVEREGHAQSFVDEVQAFEVTGGFADPDDLEQALSKRLRAIAAEDLSPWVKIGRCLIRAAEIRISGAEAMITAVVRDHEVADELGLLADRFGSPTTSLAYFDGVFDARLENLEATSRVGNSRQLTFTFKVESPPGQQEYSFNGVSWAEATKIAIEVSWFGAENPFGPISGFQAELTNPFAQLAGLAVAEEAYRPIVRLLASEILRRERNVSRLTRFRLGRAVAGTRPLRLSWRQPSQYSGHDPETLTAEGRVSV